MSDTSTNPRPPALEFEEGRRVVIETIRPLVRQLKTELVALEEAYGSILAESIRAERDYPALARSLRDGYAVRAADVPGTLAVRGEVRAGDEEQPGADRVVREVARVQGQDLTCKASKAKSA